MPVKPIKIERYNTLKECFMEFMGWESINDEDLKKSYWCGHNGSRPFRINAAKWLADPKKKCWGWANFKSKTIHMWVADDCEQEELIGLLAHEAAHLRRPRYKDKQEEEKKAVKTALDATFAFTVSNLILTANSPFGGIICDKMG